MIDAADAIFAIDDPAMSSRRIFAERACVDPNDCLMFRFNRKSPT